MAAVNAEGGHEAGEGGEWEKWVERRWTWARIRNRNGVKKGEEEEEREKKKEDEQVGGEEGGRRRWKWKGG